jgi:5-formyltetrahydrofolate cyclo-ligase
VSEPEFSKRQLRQLLRARRRALSVGQRRRAAIQLAQRAQRQIWFIRARSLALYIAADSELDPCFLIQAALARGKRVYLPQLRAGYRLSFGEYRKGMRLRRNRFGIPEPQQRSSVKADLDVVCLPLVAFDRRGNRLGMGGGFYDRTFAGKCPAQPRLVGLAYRIQEVESLPCDVWDVPLAGVQTERSWLKAGL